MPDYLVAGGFAVLGLKVVILFISHAIAYRLGYNEGLGRWIDYAIVMFPMAGLKDGETAEFMGHSEDQGE